MTTMANELDFSWDIDDSRDTERVTVIPDSYREPEEERRASQPAETPCAIDEERPTVIPPKNEIDIILDNLGLECEEEKETENGAEEEVESSSVKQATHSLQEEFLRYIEYRKLEKEFKHYQHRAAQRPKLNPDLRDWVKGGNHV